MTGRSADKWLCEDWACPARVSCARHFGRSSLYGALRERHPPLRHGPRDRGQDSCAEYRFDRPRQWLLVDFNPNIVGIP
ncbi:MAG TPA: hypothetical protein VHG92_02800 [Afifellaceae bacterium]|nr:hypothetical protein [Afifellaceae bacterium]